MQAHAEILHGEHVSDLPLGTLSLTPRAITCRFRSACPAAAKSVLWRGEPRGPRAGDRRGGDPRGLECARQARGRSPRLPLVRRRRGHPALPARRDLRAGAVGLPPGRAALRDRHHRPALGVLLQPRPRVPLGRSLRRLSDRARARRRARAHRRVRDLRRAPLAARHARRGARGARHLRPALATAADLDGSLSRPAPAGRSPRASSSRGTPSSTRPAWPACLRWPTSGSWSWAHSSCSCRRCWPDATGFVASGGRTGWRSWRRGS